MVKLIPHGLRGASAFRPLRFADEVPLPSPERIAAGKRRLMRMAAERRGERLVAGSDGWWLARSAVR